MKTTILGLSMALMLLVSCGDKSTPSLEVAIEPSELIILKMKNLDYSVVLNDMDMVEENNLMTFKHKYHILANINDTVRVDSLDWMPVNESFFIEHEHDLGMEIVSNHNNKLSRVVQPIGFGWAIGNEKYGEWEAEIEADSTKTTTNNQHKRAWRSRGPSFFLLYMMMRRPVYQRDYNSYRTTTAAGRGYYGNTYGTSKYKYGTRSGAERRRRPGYYSRVSSSSTWKSLSKRKSRSSSRYNSSSSTRSRSRGFGK